MKRYLPFVIVFAVALLTIGSGAVLYRAKRSATLTVSKGESVSGPEGPALHVRGDRHASVTLDEFADFQCPLCAKTAATISEFERDYRPRLRVIFHHYPLVTHAHARSAAFAAEAAGLQGRFWEMHDLLYREQPVWSKSADSLALFDSYAGMLGLDVARFKKDRESEAVEARVDADQSHAASLGVQATPTIFLNNRAVPPTDLNPIALRAAIEAAVNPKPSS